VAVANHADDHDPLARAQDEAGVMDGGKQIGACHGSSGHCNLPGMSCPESGSIRGFRAREQPTGDDVRGDLK
jgi:hypothetical protein